MTVFQSNRIDVNSGGERSGEGGGGEGRGQLPRPPRCLIINTAIARRFVDLNRLISDSVVGEQLY